MGSNFLAEEGREVSSSWGSLDQATLEVLLTTNVPGTDDFCGKVVGMFLADFGPRVQELRAVVDGQDAAIASASAHSLEGSCLYVGAVRLAGLFAEIDKAARTRDFSGAQKILDAAGAEFIVVKQALEQLRR